MSSKTGPDWTWSLGSRGSQGLEWLHWQYGLGKLGPGIRTDPCRGLLTTLCASIFIP